jgi:serine/threonine-protein kinase
MAPEQVDSAGAVTARSDVYSLGAILYELLAGRPPHVADSVERLLFSILTARPVPLAELRPEVPGELCDVVHRALSSDPEQRFATARDLADALGRFAKPEAGVTTLRASSPVVAARKLAGSTTWALRSVAALLAGVALAALGLARSLPRGTTHAAAKPAAQPVAALIAQPKPALPAAEPAAQAFSPSARALPPRESTSPVVMPEPASARHSTASQQSNAAHPRAARPTISTPKHEASMDADMPLPRIQFVLANPYEH